MRFNRHFVSEPGEMQFAYDSETRVECVRMCLISFCDWTFAWETVLNMFRSVISCRLPTFAWDPPLGTFGSFGFVLGLLVGF